MNIHQVLTKHFAGYQWVQRGMEYSGLEWLDASPKPTEAELLALWETVKFDGNIQAVKLDSNRRIIALTGGGEFWRERQMNALVRFSELMDKRISGESLTEAESAEVAQLKAIWSQIKAIRAHSNALEAQILAGEAVDITAGWP